MLTLPNFQVHWHFFCLLHELTEKRTATTASAKNTFFILLKFRLVVIATIIIVVIVIVVEQILKPTVIGFRIHLTAGHAIAPTHNFFCLVAASAALNDVKVVFVLVFQRLFNICSGHTADIQILAQWHILAVDVSVALAILVLLARIEPKHHQDHHRYNQQFLHFSIFLQR